MVEINKHQIDGSWMMLRRMRQRMRYLKTNGKTMFQQMMLPSMLRPHRHPMFKISRTLMFKIISLLHQPLTMFETIPVW